MVESNGKEMVVHGEHQKATTPKLWQPYEFDGRRRSISTANQHDQPNRIKLVLSKLVVQLLHGTNGTVFPFFLPFPLFTIFCLPLPFPNR